MLLLSCISVKQINKSDLSCSYSPQTRDHGQKYELAVLLCLMGMYLYITECTLVITLVNKLHRTNG